jgi:hypothetical protein
MTDEGLPETVEEACDYIVRYAADIYVRERGPDGQWGSFALTELPADKAVEHALRFIREGQVPHRIVREEKA